MHNLPDSTPFLVSLRFEVIHLAVGSKPDLIALSNISSAIRPYVVHLPPIIVRSPEDDNVILCLRDTSFVEEGFLLLAARGLNPANMLRISVRQGGLIRYLPVVCKMKSISFSRAMGSRLTSTRGVSVVPMTTSLYHGIANKTLPSSVLGIIMAKSL